MCQVSVQSELGADPCKEIKYKETAVDAMRMQKDEVSRNSQAYTVGAKINFPFPFLTQQEKRSRTDRAVGVPCL